MEVQFTCPARERSGRTMRSVHVRRVTSSSSSSCRRSAADLCVPALKNASMPHDRTGEDERSSWERVSPHCNCDSRSSRFTAVELSRVSEGNDISALTARTLNKVASGGRCLNSLCGGSSSLVEFASRTSRDTLVESGSTCGIRELRPESGDRPSFIGMH